MSDILGRNRVLLRYDFTPVLTNGLVPFSASVQIRGNNIYDPEYSTGGGQPLGFDQWAPFFKRFNVISSKVTVRAANLSANALTCTLLATPTVPSIVDQNHARSLPNSKQVIVTSVNATGQATLSMNLTTAKVFQIDQNRFDDDDDVYSGTFAGTPPAREWIWTIYAQTMNVAALSVACSVTVEYMCEFYDPVTQQPS